MCSSDLKTPGACDPPEPDEGVVYRINLSQVRGSVIDLTTEGSRQMYLRNEIARRFANKSKEVVIEGSIPPDAITIIKRE